MNPKIIEFTQGTMTGVRAYVTYEEPHYMRVTPIDGDPLWSLEVDTRKIKVREVQANEGVNV